MEFFALGMSLGQKGLAAIIVNQYGLKLHQNDPQTVDNKCQLKKINYITWLLKYLHPQSSSLNHAASDPLFFKIVKIPKFQKPKKYFFWLIFLVQWLFLLVFATI